jgi:RNAse (barnase) inhibitor barstar
MKTYTINGQDFSTLEQFFDTIGQTLIPTSYWGHNLDAFDDILGGGFGTPENGFVIVWKNSEFSRMKLGFDETVRQLSQRLIECHPLNREVVEKQLQDAKHETGPTVFDWLIDIILEHGPDGEQSLDNVTLRLE